MGSGIELCQFLKIFLLTFGLLLVIGNQICTGSITKLVTNRRHSDEVTIIVTPAIRSLDVPN